MPTIHPFLWFKSEAEEARDFYLSVFKTARPLESRLFGGQVSGKSVPLSTFDFELEGMRVTALNAGSHPAFNESFSFYVETADQAETDYYYSALTAGGGVEKPCGWLVDKYGVYWQVAPKILTTLTSDPDRAKAERALQAMYRMTRIVIADLEAAHAGKA